MNIGVWDLATVIAKATVYAATFAASGGVFFLAYCRDLLSDLNVARIRRLIGVAIGVAITCSLARVGILAGSMSDAMTGMVDPAMLRMVLGSGEGAATAVRVLGLTLTALALLPSRRLPVIAWIGAVFAATSFAWVGHAHVAGSEGLTVSLLGMHLICVAFWLGALGPLLLIARDPDPARFGAAAARFGRIALWGVGLLLAAGTVLLACLLGTVSEFWSSDYGRAFVAKLGLVVCLLGSAALNKLRLTPRVNTGVAGASSSLARSIRVEIAVGGLILLTTAALTTLWGPATLE